MKRDLEELEDVVRTILSCSTNDSHEYVVEEDLMEEILELIQSSIAPPPSPPVIRKFLCFTAFIETTDPDVVKVAAKVRRDIELGFGDNLVGTEWSVREGTR